jgi:hypothetical protein
VAEYRTAQLPTIFGEIRCYDRQRQRLKPPRRCRQFLHAPRTVYNGGISLSREVPTDYCHSLPMGIRFSCPNGHKLNVKAHLAGKRAICPHCGSKVVVPDPPAQLEARAAATPRSISPSPTAAVPAVELGSVDLLPASILPHPSAERAYVLSGPADALPESILAATFGTPEPEPAESSAESAAHAYHSRGRRNQLIVSVVLLLIVVLLAFALYWVLSRHALPTPPAPADTATSGAAATVAEPPSPVAPKAATQNTTNKESAAPAATTPDAPTPSEPAPSKKE